MAMLRFQCLASDGVAGKEKPYQAVVEWFPTIGAISVFKGWNTPTRFARDQHGQPCDGSAAVRGARIKALQLQMHISELINLLPSGTECAPSAHDVPEQGELHFLGVVRHTGGKSEFSPRMLRLSVERGLPTLEGQAPARDANAAALHVLYRDLLRALLPFGRLHFTALISPVSGKGEGFKVWSTVAAPVIAASPHSYSVISTTHRGHAEEYAAEAELKPNEVLVAVGGDGMAHEVVNGFRRRYTREGEWAAAASSRMPRVATFPTGSGCALAKTLGVIKPIDAALALIASHSLELDVMDLHFDPAPRMVPGKTEKDPRVEAPAEALTVTDRTAFLSVNMCFGAAVDLESEKYRWMGNNRFAFYAVKKLIGNVPRYPMSVRYKPARLQQLSSPLVRESTAAPDTPLVTLGSITQHVKPFDFRLDAFAGRSTELSQSVLATSTDDEWISIDQSEYTFLIACNIPWIARDMLGAPYSHLNDQCIDLVYAASDLTRTELIKAMIEMEEGKHVHLSKLRYIKCRELEITPKDGLLSIDGERFPLAKVTAKVSDVRLRVIHAPVVATPAECEPLVIAACVASLPPHITAVTATTAPVIPDVSAAPMMTARSMSPRREIVNPDASPAHQEEEMAVSPTSKNPPRELPTDNPADAEDNGVAEQLDQAALNEHTAGEEADA